MDSELLIQANSSPAEVGTVSGALTKLSYFSNLEFMEYLAIKIT